MKILKTLTLLFVLALSTNISKGQTAGIIINGSIVFTIDTSMSHYLYSNQQYYDTIILCKYDTFKCIQFTGTTPRILSNEVGGGSTQYYHFLDTCMNSGSNFNIWTYDFPNGGQYCDALIELYYAINGKQYNINYYIMTSSDYLQLSSIQPFCNKSPEVNLDAYDGYHLMYGRPTNKYYPSNIIWNYGIGDTLNTTSFIGASQEYSTTILFPDGCNVKDSVLITTKTPMGKVCWTTVDTSSTHSLIVWDTTGISKEAIDSLRLYFYNASNQWQKIGEESILDTNRYFVDNSNNPNANTCRYMILSVDSCGDIEDTINSPWHNTMFISNNGSGTFSWAGTGYLIDRVSQPVLTYYLYRNDTIIDSVSGTQNKMTDVNYSPSSEYYVGAKLNIDMCPINTLALGRRPERVGVSSSNLSHSNIINRKPTSIVTVSDANLFSIYPNPSSGNFNLDLTKESDVRIYDVTGRLLYQQLMPQGRNELNIEGSAGLYMLSVNGAFKKIIKE